jgi:hypothetical protein
MSLEPVRPNAPSLPEPRRPFLSWFFPSERELKLYAEDTAWEVVDRRHENAWRMMLRTRVCTDQLADIINQRRINSDSPLEVLSAERHYVEWMQVSSQLLQAYVNRPL